MNSNIRVDPKLTLLFFFRNLFKNNNIKNLNKK